MSKRTKTPGKHYRFTYPNYGTPDGHPDYTAHSNQIVVIERQLTNKECDPECQPMWKIRAKDGWTGSAHSCELRAIKPPKAPKQKKVFACCRWSKRSQPIFYAVCSTMDIAMRQVDKLTARFGPTFVIIDAPLDP